MKNDIGNAYMDATACIEIVYLFQSKLVKTNYLNNLLFVLWLGSAIRGWVGGCFCICSWQKSLSCWNAVEMRESDEREWRGGANSRCCCQERKWKGRGPPLTKPGEMEESPNKNTYNGGIANKEIHPPWAPPSSFSTGPMSFSSNWLLILLGF